MAAPQSALRRRLDREPLAAGLQDYLLRLAAPWERILLLIAAVLLIKPGYISDAIGITLLAVVLLVQRRALAVPR